MAFEKVKEIIKYAPSFAELTDLAAERLGGKRGKWMDGWESRRKRTPGHDWAVVELAAPGMLAGFDIDTNFFLGNHPPHASIEAVYLKQSEIPTHATEVYWQELNWQEILRKSNLDAGSQNFYEINDKQIFTRWGRSKTACVWASL